MNQELKFNGYTAQPSDYECQDGDLAAVLNLMPEKGAMRPVTKPKDVLTLNSANRKVVAIHEGAFGKHYIVYDSSLHRFYSLNSTASPSVAANYNPIGGVIASYQSVATIGNVLVVLTGSSIKYYLWDISSYKDLGDMPELTMQFQSTHRHTSQLFKVEDVSFNTYIHKNSQTGYISITSPVNLNETDQNALTEKFLAQANKAVAEAHDAGYFIFPFFVRYAFRMYDGSTTRASAPVLILPTTLTPFVPMTYDGDTFSFYARSHLLSYIINDGAELTKLKKWKDIITSVDIFVSAPIYTYDQAGKVKRVVPESMYETPSGSPGLFGEHLGNGFYTMSGGNMATMSLYGGTAAMELPQFDNILEKFESVSAFYLYESLNVEDLVAETVTEIAAKQNYIPVLAQKEVLQDDYDSHDTYIAKGAFNYNARLNLFGMKKRKFDGFHPSACFPRVTTGTAHTRYVEDGYWTSDYEEGRGESTIQYWVDTSYYETYYDGDFYVIDCFVHIKTEGYETIVMRGCDPKVTFGTYGIPRWFYYPDAKAYKAVFVIQHIPDIEGANSQDPLNVQIYTVELPLKPHGLLNGAFYFNGFEPPAYTYILQYDLRDCQQTDEWQDFRTFEYELNNSSNTPASCKPLWGANGTINVLNKIYTSEVNNPFVYAVTNINTIGNGEILSIATAAKALSQGQFGQFPMYAFTTDGIWALEVSAATGAFSARQPISRDVCINANSVTQIDSAVLFASDRGIMLIAGSQVQCISDTIDNNEEPFIFTNIPLSSKIRNLIFPGEPYGETENPLYPAFPEQKFTTVFLTKCQMLYAYDRQAIIVFNPDYGYCYVYSLESKQWGMIYRRILSKLNSYPQAYAMIAGGKMVDFSQEGTMPASQFLITRPLKLDPSLKDVNKTIDNVIARGRFDKGHVKVILYGSRDLEHWFPIATSVDHYLRGFRGTPYKYFRIALVCSLTHDESIWGASIQYTPRLTNQPR